MPFIDYGVLGIARRCGFSDVQNENSKYKTNVLNKKKKEKKCASSASIFFDFFLFDWDFVVEMERSEFLAAGRRRCYSVGPHFSINRSCT